MPEALRSAAGFKIRGICRAAAVGLLVVIGIADEDEGIRPNLVTGERSTANSPQVYIFEVFKAPSHQPSWSVGRSRMVAAFSSAETVVTLTYIP